MYIKEEQLTNKKLVYNKIIFEFESNQKTKNLIKGETNFGDRIGNVYSSYKESSRFNKLPVPKYKLIKLQIKLLKLMKQSVCLNLPLLRVGVK